MSFDEDPRISKAKMIPVPELLNRLGIFGLTQKNSELSGPCPLCGDEGHNPRSGPVDRFNINAQTGQFLCRKCGIDGGDQIALVRHVEGLSFPDALQFLCGDRPELNSAERDRLKAEAEARARRQSEQQNVWRRKAIEGARIIWDNAGPAVPGGMVDAYLRARGLPLNEIPKALRFLPDHPCVKSVGGRLETLHRGPCMIAGIWNFESRELMAVHQTWIDPEPPHGKARIDFEGEAHPAKMVRGAKKGSVIPLVRQKGSSVLVMGEGIETTLSAYFARPVGLEDAAYWAGIDLGNMAGKMLKVKGVRYSEQPDMADDEAFVPPPWVTRLIYIQDGDSDPKATRAKLLCGLRRAKKLRPGLQVGIVPAGQGVDLNDVLTGKKIEKEGQEE